MVLVRFFPFHLLSSLVRLGYTAPREREREPLEEYALKVIGASRRVRETRENE